MPESRIDGALAALGIDGRDRHVIGPVSGTGNASVRLTLDGEELVLRLGEQDGNDLVDRTRESAHARKAASLGIAPELLAFDPETGAALTRFVEGRRLDTCPRPLGGEILRRLARTLAALRGATGFGGAMDPWQKIAAYLARAQCRDPASDDAFGPVWNAVEELRPLCRIDPDRLVPAHVDPVPENIVDCGGRVVLLDWEYSGLSHPLWDPAYFAAEAGLTGGERRILLEESGMADRLEALENWTVLAAAVSLAWCVLRHRRADGDAFWDREVRRRRAALSRHVGMQGHGR